MTKEEAYTLLEVMAINITGELIGSGHIITEQTKLLAKQLEAIDMAQKALSIDVVQGEWEFVDHEIFAREYFCSICGKRAEVDLYGEWILSNYCPSCGAIMENK